jgi:hypothetical protein
MPNGTAGSPARLNAVRAESRSGTRAPGEIRDLRGLLDRCD